MKILLVDDSKSARYALRLQLQRHGAVVETADSAETALARVKEEQPDAVFMDQTMPGMNGFEALDVLKSSPQTARIPVVMCTPSEDPEFIALARRKGALDVLSKSPKEEELPSLLQRIDQIVAGTTSENAELKAGSAPPNLSQAVSNIVRSEADRLITERLNATLDQHLEQAIEPFVTRFRERLTAEVLTQAEQRLGQRFDAETQRLQKHFIGVQTDYAQLSANRLRNEILPQAVSQQIDQERQNLARMVQELIDRSLDSLSEEPAFVRRILDLAEATALNTTEDAAKQQVQEIAETVVSEQIGRLADGLARSTRTTLHTMYALAAGAALTGIGASALVYLLVG
jgi:CheY-like chemotaxis protein